MIVKRPILKDVARKARVSVGLASRILRNHGSFSEATRSRVLKAVKELDYQPNVVARSLKIRQTKALGVLISDIASHFFAHLVRGIEDAAAMTGYSVILCNTDENATKEKAYLTALYERNVDGLIICASPGNDTYIKKIARGGQPVILVYRKIGGLRIPRIATDDEAASYKATNYFIGLGHRQIGIIAGISGVQSSEERFNGYRQALEDNDIALRGELVVHGEYQTDTAFRVSQVLLSVEPRPTAILACSELMTIGLLQALRARSMKVPDDVSVIGFDDPSWASLMNPQLTMIRLPGYQMGLLAGETLINLLVTTGSYDKTEEELVLKSKFVIRESCRRI